MNRNTNQLLAETHIEKQRKTEGKKDDIEETFAAEPQVGNDQNEVLREAARVSPSSQQQKRLRFRSWIKWISKKLKDVR